MHACGAGAHAAAPPTCSSAPHHPPPPDPPPCQCCCPPCSLPAAGKGFSVAFDPLDGSSIVDTNFSVGTIFGVWPGDELIGVTGRDQVRTGLVAGLGWGSSSSDLLCCWH